MSSQIPMEKINATIDDLEKDERREFRETMINRNLPFGCIIEYAQFCKDYVVYGFSVDLNGNFDNQSLPSVLTLSDLQSITKERILNSIQLAGSQILVVFYCEKMQTSLWSKLAVDAFAKRNERNNN
jgi:hypothetical protein